MEILQIGNPILEKKTRKVNDVNGRKIQKLIGSMTDFVLNDDESVGLAAPQVGKDLAICVVKRVADRKIDDESQEVKEVFPLINPEIISTSKKTLTYWEGCLSVGEGEERLFGPVTRPKSVRIKYLDQSGKENFLEAEGFFAFVIQHEIDHLKGVLFLSHIQDPRNIWRSRDLDKYIEEHREFPSIIGMMEEVPAFVVD